MVLRTTGLVVTSLALAMLGTAQAVAADPRPDFGDDTSEYAKDGECDDLRFEGPGMTQTALLDSDVGHDATDCRVAFEQDRLTLRDDTGEDLPPAIQEALEHIQWGDNESEFANDGECDDMRFTGPGMTDTPLLVSDVQHDASDCRVAFRQGRLSLAE
jgi:hypothetical protein